MLNEKDVIVVHYPDYRKGNMYQSLLCSALEINDVKAFFISGNKKLFKLALKNKVDIVHLHWLTTSILGGNIFKSFAKSMFFLLTLIIFKINKVKIFWTVHNLKNHENKQVKHEYLILRTVGSLSTSIIVHGHKAREMVSNYFKVPIDKVHVLHHGNYDGHVLPNIKRESIRNNYGIKDDETVFLYFGLIRPYKNVINLMLNFHNLKCNSRLIIAGKPKSNELKVEIEKIAIQDSRIILKLFFLSDQDLANLLEMSDVVVLPYKDVFTSGSVLLSLTFGVPVIAPKTGLIPEYLDETCSFLYDNSEEDGLYNALEKACLNLNEDMGYPARKKAEQYKWEVIGKKLARLYHSSL